MKAILSILTLLVLVSCGTQRSAVPSSGGAPYDVEGHVLHPEMMLYHHAGDSSSVYFRIQSSDLLYTRPSGSDAFQATLLVELFIEPLEKGQAGGDSVSFRITDRNATLEERALIVQRSVPMADGNWRVRAHVRDTKRESLVELVLLTQKQPTPGPHDFLLRSADGVPHFGHSAATGDTLLLACARCGANTVRLLQFSQETKLPPPPFSGNAPDLPQLQGGSSRELLRKDDGSLAFTMGNVLHFITADPSEKTGFTLFPSPALYPDVRNFDQLAPPLRYITSRAEFDAIQQSSFPKDKVDDFWIECAGSKERARELIRIYYSRVEEANRFFSSYTEGWRTDRGMIHLVFGNPNRVYRNESSETWIYGEEGHPSSVTFHFRKAQSPFSDNVYLLQRDPMFKQVWENHVTTWRQGRVYNE